MKPYPSSAKNCLIVGSVAIDRVTTPEAQSEPVLGGAASYAALAASYFAPSRMVGIVGRDFPKAWLNLYRRHHIDLEGLKIDKEGETFFWAGRYKPDFAGRETQELRLNVFESFNPELPSNYRGSPFVMLGAIMPSLQLKVIDQLVKRPSKPFILADTFDHWIASKRNEVEEMLQAVDMLVINEEESALLTGETNILRAAPKIRKMGPSIVIIKKGGNGSALFHPEGYFCIPAYPVAKLVDPTGAGDSFAGALTGYLASKGRSDFGTLKKAMAYATAVSSLTVESFSVTRLAKAGRAVIDKRFQALVDITRF